jgi:hypothetical protein
VSHGRKIKVTLNAPMHGEGWLSDDELCNVSALFLRRPVEAQKDE